MVSIGFANMFGYGIEKIEGSFIQGSKEQWNDEGHEMASIGFANVFGCDVEKIEGK